MQTLRADASRLRLAIRELPAAYRTACGRTAQDGRRVLQELLQRWDEGYDILNGREAVALRVGGSSCLEPQSQLAIELVKRGGVGERAVARRIADDLNELLDAVDRMRPPGIVRRDTNQRLAIFGEEAQANMAAYAGRASLQ
jgi:hypothetical protein